MSDIPTAPLGDARFWLAAITASSEDAILGIDMNGIVTSWNKAAESMFGYASDEVIGQPIGCILPPERIDEEVSILVRLRSGEKIAHFETERQRKNGGLFQVSITVSPVCDDQNRIIGICKVARDLTDRARREDKLRAANAELERVTRHLVEERDRAKLADRAKSQFLADMSHELRSPLGGVLGHAELLQIAGGLNAAQAARVEAILTTGKHLLEMINCVLDLSEIKTKCVELQLVNCDVLAIATACLDLVRPVAEAKDLALSIAVIPGTQLRLVTDPVRLRQVLFNLLGNAAKFTSRGAIELRLRTLADGSTLRIEVTDTGPGLSADQRQRLFRDFERPEPTAKVFDDSALGLALSARLAALMGGRLGHDDNPGGGSVFWLELAPNSISGSFPATAPASDAPDAKPISARGLSILIVDDIAMSRDVAGSFLRASGHNVTCAEGGAEAIAAAARTDFDLVLMDVRMPEMDGLEATRRIRKLDGPRGRVPIVALTAHAFTEQVEACRSAGMDGHVSKPFTHATLLAAVATFSAGRAHNESDRRVPMLAVSDIAMIGEELMVFDRNAFDSVAHYIPPKMVATYIKTITERGEALLLELHHGNASTHAGDELADAAHALAGSAGMLGFERVATLGRGFEHALRSGAADAPALAGALGAAIKATLRAIADLRAAGPTKANGVKFGRKPSRPRQQPASGSNATPAAKRTERRLSVKQRAEPRSGTT